MIKARLPCRQKMHGVSTRRGRDAAKYKPRLMIYPGYDAEGAFISLEAVSTSPQPADGCGARSLGMRSTLDQI